MCCMIAWTENPRFAKRLGEDFPLSPMMMGAVSSIEKAPDTQGVEGFALEVGVSGLLSDLRQESCLGELLHDVARQDVLR